MKKTKLGKVLCACLISILSLGSVCKADEQSTSVSYIPTFENIEPTEVKVIIIAKTSAFGGIYDGDRELDIGETIYNLKYGETKVFRIQPAIGYDVEKILYDGKDITNQLKSTRSLQKVYIIQIAGVGHDAEFEVIYKELKEEEPDKPAQPDIPTNPDTPTTPDKPTNPDTATTPDKPTIPDTPAKPNVPNGATDINASGNVNDTTNQTITNTSNKHSPHTGVMIKTYDYIIMFMISMVVIIATFLLKKSRKKDENI